MQPLDYSALRAMPTLIRGILHAEGNWRQYPGAKILYILWAIICLPFTLLLLLPVIWIVSTNTDDPGWPVLVLLLYIVVFIFIAGLPKRLASTKANRYFEHFFADNHLHNASAYYGYDYPFGGRTITFRHRYEAIELDYDDRIIVWVSTLSLSLGKHVPHIVLDSLGNNRLMSSLTHQYNRSQLITLEGDFDTYYELYAPTKHRVDALSILSPDVMAVLIDSGAQFDIELVDQSLVIRTLGHVLTDPDTLQAMHAVMQAVAPEVLHRMRSWRQADESAYTLQRARQTHAVRVGPVNIPVYTRWLGPTSEYGAYALVVFLCTSVFGFVAFQAAFEQRDPLGALMALLIGTGVSAFGVLLVAAFDSRV